MCFDVVLVLKFRRCIIREAGLSPPLDDDEQLAVSLLCSFASYVVSRCPHRVCTCLFDQDWHSRSVSHPFG